MPTPSTSAEFLELTRKSGVVEEKRLHTHVETLRSQSRLPTEPTKLAGVLVRDGIITHFQAQQLLQGKWRRFTIGKYKVLERLGSGGMGQVYLCEHRLMRRRVAIKVLPTAKAAEESSLGRFYREARAVAALDHPNIVHAYDIDQDDTLHFLVMEYVDGASLQEIVRKSGPLDPVRAANYVYQSALGLAHAHTAGLVHRDVKPGNLLVDRNGVLKILDMGLARFFNDEDDVLTRKFDETVLGTADYLAPEQAVDSHEADTRADIYSLGATFYFMLTSRTPFEEGTVAQKLIWHQTRQPKAITTFRKDVPPQMIAIVNKMMAKVPEDRYQSPLEVAEALQPWMNATMAPPLESEMPKLSPAAVGPITGDTVQSSITPSTAQGSGRKWQVAGTQSVEAPPARPPTPVSPPPQKSTVPTPAPAAQNTPNAMKPSSPVPAGTGKRGTAPALPTVPLKAPPAARSPGTNHSPWETLDADQFGTSDSHSGRRTQQKPSQSAMWVWICLAAAVVLGVGGAIVWRVAFPPPQNVTPSPPAQKIWKVSKNTKLAGTVETIQRALREARAGDIIELWDNPHEENLIVDPKKGRTHVTLRPAPGKAIVWTCPPGGEKEPLLKLNKAQHFHLDGKGLRLDGRERMNVLVQVTLQSTGLKITGAQLHGFTRQAISVANCEGTQRQPVLFEDLKFTPGKGWKNIFWFTARPMAEGAINDHIWVRHCIFPTAPRQQIFGRQGKVLGPHTQLKMD